jgi:murein DD-endopeptidase MepM/ murein hydrolase activator NlpD
MVHVLTQVLLVPMFAMLALPVSLPSPTAGPPAGHPAGQAGRTPEPLPGSPHGPLLAPQTLREQTPTEGVWPLDPMPTVVTGFDPPASPYGPGHRGVDLAGTRGQDVRATAAGRVTFAGMLAGRGVVVVSHGRTRSTYEPVRASVAVGSVVDAGTRLGTLEASGSHCWPDVCLHWGHLEGETYLDPLMLIGAGPVRLLPLRATDRR